MTATGYHVTNVLLHIGSAILLWRVLRRLRIPGAWLAALIFAIHPVNVESVAWITERKNTLAMFFYALTLWCYLRFLEAANQNPSSGVRSTRSATQPSSISSRTWYCLSLVAFLCALLSKTSVVMAPFVLLLLAWWQGRSEIKVQSSAPSSSPKPRSSSRPFTQSLTRLVPFFAISLALGLVTVWFQYHRAIGEDIMDKTDFTIRLAAAGWSVWFYLYKALVPLNLSFVYPAWQTHWPKVSISSFLPFLPALVLVLAFGVFWRYRRTWSRAPLFTLAYFVLMLLPVLGFLNVYFQRYSPVADHWQYFSIIAPIALGAGFLVVQSSKFGVRSSTRRTRTCSFILGSLGAMWVATLIVLSFQQTKIYANSETLWLDTLRKNPDSWLAHNNFGQLLAAQGRTEEAIQHYSESLRLHPQQAEARNNLGSVFLEQGKLEAATVQFNDALKFNPRAAVAWYNLGNVLDQQGRRSEAIANYRRALELLPQYPDAHNNLACLLAADGELNEALFHFRQALRFRPDYPDACNNLGSILNELGQPREAARHLTKAIALNPNYADAHHNLGNALLQSGKISEAAAQYQAALELKPALAESHYKLGNILMKAGRAEEALQHYRAALQTRPAFAEVHYQVGVLLAARNEIAEGIRHLQEAVRLKPDWPEALNNLAWLLCTQTDGQYRNGLQALRLAKRAVELTGSKSPGTLDTLAAANADLGQFDQAIATAQQAAEAASAAGQKELAAHIQSRLQLYRSEQPYRE